MHILLISEIRKKYHGYAKCHKCNKYYALFTLSEIIRSNVVDFEALKVYTFHKICRLLF